jgi:ribonuclease III
LKAELDKLERALDYRFRSQSMLGEALTHRSAAGNNNERLEFLGDGILNFVIASELFHRRPDDPEGILSRLRASLVNRVSLAELARELELGAYLRLGSGELKSGGHRRDSILADALEAIFGAVYLDGGYEQCRALVLRLYRERLDSLPEIGELKDPKTRLQEYLQGTRQALPIYTVLEISGKAHDQSFRVRCQISDDGIETEGVGSSRRQAEQCAAEAMLEALQA